MHATHSRPGGSPHNPPGADTPQEQTPQEQTASTSPLGVGLETPLARSP